MPAAETFIDSLVYEPLVEWPERLKTALGALRSATASTIDECGHALAAGYLVAVSAGAALDTSGVPKVVLRQAPRALKSKARASLFPLALKALETIRNPKSEMMRLMSEADDFQVFLEQLSLLEKELRRQSTKTK